MTFTLKEVVPWGRNFAEYQEIFDLTPTDLSKSILGCGDGPASFNAEATQRGINVISCDPIYDFSAEAISGRVNETYAQILDQLRAHPDQFVWKVFESPEALGEARLNAMRGFLADFEKGKAEGRYITAALPALPFEDQQFELALCSHFLFLYSEQLTLDFHLQALHELCRVANEVRIFPLHNLANQPSAYLDEVTQDLREHGYTVEQRCVSYEFQKGGNKMLHITR